MHRSRGQTEIDLRLLWVWPNGMGGLFVQNSLYATGSWVLAISEFYF